KFRSSAMMRKPVAPRSPPIAAPISTRIPPSAAIRIVVRTAAEKLDLRVVVILGATLARVERSSNGGTPDAWWYGSRPRFEYGHTPSPSGAAKSRHPDWNRAPRGPILGVEMRSKNLLTQVLVANLMLIVVAVVVTGIAGNPSLNL